MESSSFPSLDLNTMNLLSPLPPQPKRSEDAKNNSNNYHSLNQQQLQKEEEEDSLSKKRRKISFLSSTQNQSDDSLNKGDFISMIDSSHSLVRDLNQNFSNDSNRFDEYNDEDQMNIGNKKSTNESTNNEMSEYDNFESGITFSLLNDSSNKEEMRVETNTNRVVMDDDDTRNNKVNSVERNDENKSNDDQNMTEGLDLENEAIEEGDKMEENDKYSHDLVNMEQVSEFDSIMNEVSKMIGEAETHLDEMRMIQVKNAILMDSLVMVGA